MEFIPLKDGKKTTPTQKVSLPFGKRLQISVAFRVFRLYTFYSPQKVREMSRVHSAFTGQNYRKWCFLLSNLLQSKADNTNMNIACIDQCRFSPLICLVWFLTHPFVLPLVMFERRDVQSYTTSLIPRDYQDNHLIMHNHKISFNRFF